MYDKYTVNTLAGPNGNTAETDVRLIAGITPLWLLLKCITVVYFLSNCYTLSETLLDSYVFLLTIYNYFLRIIERLNLNLY